MAFVKHFDVNGINTIQTACIELQAPPNAATEGAVGLLAIDLSSPTKDVYKCVAVNGAIYTWELLSSGASILSSSETGEGSASATFTYASLRKENNYVVKVGDLILDSLGYLYRITALGNTSCTAEYCYLYVNGANGVSISSVEQSEAVEGVSTITITLSNGSTHSFTVKNGASAYEVAVSNGFEGTEEEWLASLALGNLDIPTTDEDGNFILEEGKRYRIIPNATKTLTLTLKNRYRETSDGQDTLVETDIPLAIPEYDGHRAYGVEFFFDTGFVINGDDTYTLNIWWVYDGTKYHQTSFSMGRGWGEIPDVVVVSGASKCYLLSDNGEVTVSVENALSPATAEKAGTMSAEDKVKLDSMYPITIEDGDGNSISKLILEESENEDGELILNIKTVKTS